MPKKKTEGTVMDNTISINKLERFVKQGEPQETVCSFEIDGETVEYTVKRRISLTDCISFVNDVVKGCVDSDEQSVFDVVQRFYFNSALMTYYANFRLPADVRKAYEYVLAADDIVNTITDNIDPKQYEDIAEAIYKAIAFEREKILCEQRVAVTATIERLNGLAQQMDAFFGGVDGEQMSKFVSKIADAEKIDSKTMAEIFAQQVKEGN